MIHRQQALGPFGCLKALRVWGQNYSKLQQRWKIPNLPASVFSTLQGSLERKAQGSRSVWQIALQCLIKPEVRQNSNLFPLWECASQARLSSFWCKKNPTHKQNKPARMKSLLVKKNFYNFKLLPALGGSRTKEAMLGNNSFWCRGTILGEIQFTVFPKGCLKIFYRPTCICFFLMIISYRQTSCWQLSLSMTDLPVFRRYIINVLSRIWPRHWHFVRWCWFLPKEWFEKLRLFYKNPKLFAI